MAIYVLSSRAQANLTNIYAYSVEQFGKRRADQYLRNLRNRMRELARSPMLGRDRSDIKVGYRSYFEGSHAIYYIIINETKIGIIDVIHQAMDPHRHL